MNTSDILTVTKAEYIDGYKIRVYFNTGEVKVIDFSSIIATGKGLCVKLANIDYFKSFKLDPFTIDWNNEIGFDPEFLYNRGE